MMNETTRQARVTRRIKDGVRSLGHRNPHDEPFRHHLRTRLLAQAHSQATREAERTRAIVASPAHRHSPLPHRQLAIVLVTLLMASGMVVYSHVTSPTPASARTILLRALAAITAAKPYNIIHEVSKANMDLPLSAASMLTVDRWIQLDAKGLIVRDSTTVMSSTGVLLSKTVQIDHDSKTYDSRTNTLTIVQSTGPRQSLAQPFQGGLSLQQLVHSAQQGSDSTIRLLPQHWLDGISVYVVELRFNYGRYPRSDMRSPRPVTFTFYIEEQSYVIRKETITTLSPQGGSFTSSTQVVQYETVPLSSVPTSTFTMHVPSTAAIVPE